MLDAREDDVGKSDSYQGMSSDMPQPLLCDSAFRRWGCGTYGRECYRSFISSRV
jgi:hypothetical protein